MTIFEAINLGSRVINDLNNIAKTQQDFPKAGSQDAEDPQGAANYRFENPREKPRFSFKNITFWKHYPKASYGDEKLHQKRWEALESRASQIRNHFDKKFNQWVYRKANESLCEDYGIISPAACVSLVSDKVVDKVGINPFVLGIINPENIGRTIAFINPQSIESVLHEERPYFENEIKGLYEKFVEKRVADRVYEEQGVYTLDWADLYIPGRALESGLRASCRAFTPKWMNKAITWDNPELKEMIKLEDLEVSRAGVQYLREALPAFFLSLEYFRERNSAPGSEETVKILENVMAGMIQDVARVLVAVDHPENDWAREVFYIDGTIKPGMENVLMEKLFSKIKSNLKTE